MCTHNIKLHVYGELMAIICNFQSLSFITVFIFQYSLRSNYNILYQQFARNSSGN